MYEKLTVRQNGSNIELLKLNSNILVTFNAKDLTSSVMLESTLCSEIEKKMPEIEKKVKELVNPQVKRPLEKKNNENEKKKLKGTEMSTRIKKEVEKTYTKEEIDKIMADEDEFEKICISTFGACQ